MSESKKAANIFDGSVFLLVIIGIAVVVNAILGNPSVPNVRTDLTADQLYTLSDSSKAILGRLEQPLHIKLFISENLQYPDHNLEQRVRDLLSEYEIHGAGKVSFEIIHPDTKGGADDEADPAAAPGKDKAKAEDDPDEAGPKGFGIQKIPVGVRGKDEVALRMVYKGMAFIYGDATETINEVKGTDNLEYEFTKRIKILATPADARKTVGFVTGFGGPSDNPQFMQSINGAFKNIYGELITAKAVDLAKNKFVPDDVDALIILNPQNPFDEPAKYVIDQFLMQGKGVAWYQTSMKPDERMPMMPMRTPVVTALDPLFEAYGIKLNRDIVLDRKNNIVGLVFTNRGLAQVSNPTMPIFTDINEESVLTKDIPTLSFPFASTLTIMPAVLENKEIQATELVKTEPEAVTRTDISSVSFETVSEPAEGEVKGPFLVAATLQGPLASAFAGREAPAIPPPTAAPGAPAPPAPKDKVDKAPSGARIVVVGNGDFMFPNQQTGYGSQYSSLGALFLLNGVDWLVQDEDLISIRSKGIPRVLKNVDPDDHLTYQTANILGVPLLFALLGLGIWLVRRQRQQKLTL